MSATLVGIGLARFAYSALIPALVGAGWFAPAQAAYLGAANLAGYLAGVVLARSLAGRLPAAGLLRGMMLLVGVAFLACAVRFPFGWFFAWRFAAGFAGGVIMALAPPLVLARTPPARRGRVGGIVFTGVGLGVAASGTLIPLLLSDGLVATWCGLGVLCLLLTAASWRGWPPSPPFAAPLRGSVGGLAGWGLALEYGLNAVALVPHMVFLVDYVARGLGRGIATGSAVWVVYGAGAVAGPMLAGWLADRFGFRRSLNLAYPVAAAAIGVLLVAHSLTVLVLSSLVLGALTPGITGLALGRSQELAGGNAARHRAIWTACTTSFALFQALAAYGLSFLYAWSGGAYGLLFAVGTGAALLAWLINGVLGAHHHRQAAVLAADAGSE